MGRWPARRLIVPANGMQGTRLVYMGERERERYFRVRFIPSCRKRKHSLPYSSEEREEYKKGLSAGVNVLAGYGTVFFVRPSQARFNSVIDDSAAQYRIRNQGNTVVVIDEFRDRAAKNETDCAPTTKHHILPGRRSSPTSTTVGDNTIHVDRRQSQENAGDQGVKSVLTRKQQVTSMFNSTFAAITRYLFGAVWFCVSLSAGGAVNEITAVFKPDPANPMHNRFKNDEKSDAFCSSYAQLCAQQNLFSLIIGGVGFEQSEGGKIFAKHSNRLGVAYLDGGV